MSLDFLGISPGLLTITLVILAILLLLIFVQLKFFLNFRLSYSWVYSHLLWEDLLAPLLTLCYLWQQEEGPLDQEGIKKNPQMMTQSKKVSKKVAQ